MDPQCLAWPSGREPIRWLATATGVMTYVSIGRAPSSVGCLALERVAAGSVDARTRGSDAAGFKANASRIDNARLTERAITTAG